MTRSALLFVLPLLAACGADPARIAVMPETSTMRENTRSETVEIVEVSLPAYAQDQEIAVGTAAGALLLAEDAQWADEPDRALTASLVRNLTAISRAEIAASPWPLTGYAEAELTVRVDQMLVGPDGVLVMSGQYAIAREEGPQAIKPFAITVPVPVLDTVNVAHAHEIAWRELAETIVRDL